MATINETKKVANGEWIWVLAIFGLLICSLFQMDSFYGQVIVSFVLVGLLLIFLQKRTLKLTVSDSNVIVEKSVGFFINRIKKTELSHEDIKFISIWSHRYYHLEFFDKKGNRIVLQFMDIINRSKAIKLLLPILQYKSIGLRVNATIYDPAFEDLKQIIESKYSITPNKYKTSFCFDGKSYI